MELISYDEVKREISKVVEIYGKNATARKGLSELEDRVSRLSRCEDSAMDVKCKYCKCYDGVLKRCIIRGELRREEDSCVYGVLKCY